jgi:hypothetical protein
MVDPDMTTEDQLLKPRTRSVVRASRFTIPDSVPLSESDEDEVGVDSRKVYVIPLPFGAYKPPFVKKIDNSMPINLDLTQEHLATSSQVKWRYLLEISLGDISRYLQAQVHCSRQVSQEFTGNYTFFLKFS